MALDSEAKRWSMLRLSSGPGIVFNPTGSDAETSVERATVLGLYGGVAFGDVTAPTLTQNIPDITGRVGDPDIVTDLSEYFTGATSYSISPDLEQRWSFDTITGILTVVPNDDGTFGPFTVTATNAGGPTASNAFSILLDVAVGSFWFRYEQEQYRRLSEKRKREQAREQAEQIESDLDRALALAQRELEEKEARDAELVRLTRLVEKHKADVVQINQRLNEVTEAAIRQSTFSTMERLEREIRKIKEEEEFLMMATRIILNA